MAKINVDQKIYEIKDGKNLLEACLALGFDLPYFCWHPAMGSVGACRQCAIKQFKDENDTNGKIVMACMTPATDGVRVSIKDPEATAFRTSIAELLMVNHPHDCPVCDEGGECHLQDVIVMTSHTYRRFRFKKRTFKNQNLGPFVNHEMNRCIACYRCVRFYRDYAGGRDFNVFATHDDVYFGRHQDGALENEFSGNLVEVCPTGVFTDKTLKKHYTRKWDLQTAPAICTHCSLGCNMIPGERYGMLRRIRNRYHHEINGYFICDRGRYGYEFVNSDGRLRDIWFRLDRNASPSKIDSTSVIEQLGTFLSQPNQLSRTIGIGSPRASLEANFALKTLVGENNFYSGLSEKDSELVSTILQILKQGSVEAASILQVEQSDAVLILGEDVTNTAPRLALALRQSVRNAPREFSRQLKIADWQDAAVREAVQNQKGPFFSAVSHSTKMDDVATQVFRYAPDDIARLGFAIAHELDKSLPEVTNLSRETSDAAKVIAKSLLEAKNPVVVSGTGARSGAILKATANIAWALKRQKSNVRISMTAAEANSFGAGLMEGKILSEALHKIEAKQIDTVIILENGLFRRVGATATKLLLKNTEHVIVIDHTATATTPRVDVIIPCATFAECDGTFINNEGRAQRSYKVFVPKDGPDGSVRESWRWLRDIAVAAGRMKLDHWQCVDDVLSSLAGSSTSFEHVTECAPPAQFRVNGQKIPRQSMRYSGRTSMSANLSVHEPKPPEDPGTPLSFSMEGYQGEPPAPLINRYWAPKWNSVQSLNKFQEEIGGSLRAGTSGKRLIAPAPSQQTPYFQEIPSAFSITEGQWLAFPVHHIFGSEELSALAPGIEERTPKLSVIINSKDAATLKLEEGDSLNLKLEQENLTNLLVRMDDSVPLGMVGIPVGFPLLEGQDIAIPGLVKLFKQVKQNSRGSST